MRKTDGFTLIELVVAIFASTLVTAAIVTFLLMGMDTSHSVTEANQDQQNARIVLMMMENMASEGSIETLDYLSSDVAINQDWAILDEFNGILLQYSASSQSLRSGSGVTLVDGVTASSVKVTPQGIGCLLDFKMTTEAGEYETSVYCRTGKIVSDSMSETQIEEKTETAGGSASSNRLNFLSTALGQLGSTGNILPDSESQLPFTLWYCQTKSGNTGYWDGWNKDTPWCAAFVSWVIDQNEANLGYTEENLPCEANVDSLYTKVQRINNTPALLDTNVTPGDLVFFDWDLDSKSGTTDLEHVGIYLFKDDTYIYTIEGNTSNSVAYRRYLIDDPCIYCYGGLNWK